MALKVKICGVTRVEDARAACDAGADLIGLNFYTQGPRFVTAARALEIKYAIAGRSQIVGVFVNPDRLYVEDLLSQVGFDLIQFHGDQDYSALGGWPLPVIHAIRLAPGASPPPLASVPADYILLDSFDPAQFGGTGRPLSFSALADLDLGRVFIAGGLTPDNVKQAAALKPYAVDVASGIESAPGVKDHLKLRSFILNAKSSGQTR